MAKTKLPTPFASAPPDVDTPDSDAASTPLPIAAAAAAPPPLPRRSPAGPALSADTTARIAECAADETASLELFAKLYETGRLSGSERSFLRQRVAPPDVTSDLLFEKWLEKQSARVRSIREKQEAAGTPTDRQAAAERLSAAQRTEAERAPEIRLRIGALQEELRALSDATFAAGDEVTVREAAVERLRDHGLLPTSIKQALRVASAAVSGPRGKRVNLGNELAYLESVASANVLSPDGQQLVTTWLERHARELFDAICPYSRKPIPSDPPPPRLFVNGEWLGRGLPKLTAEIAAIRAQLDAVPEPGPELDAEVSRLRDYWLPQDPE